MRIETIDQLYPCPQCDEYRLVYDGMLLWHSGPRPPRNLASRNVGFSPRADVERERCYHCEHCGAEFYEDVETRRSHLYVEGGGGYYTYNGAEKRWQRDR
ncbi:MAG: hypothetical protein KKA73_29005 [Chloroflexi bacterium]|nr:hypothetical protein [Chloroflexota bacterium]MBU1751734.1 hypothetical protein [Chloroflexota bacterium]